MKFDEILQKRICGKDDLRPLFKKVQHEDGKVIATDANIMVVAPNSYSSLSIEYTNGFQNWKNAIPNHEQKELFRITLGNIKIALSNFKKVPIFKECENCEGSGLIECPHCGHDSECEDCNGDGETNEIIDNQYDKRKDCIEIQECRFNPNYIESIALITHCVGEDFFVCFKAQKDNGFVFYIKDILIVLMPYSSHHEEEYEKQISVLLS